MKKIIVLITVLSVLLLAVGCGNTAPASTEKQEKTPETVALAPNDPERLVLVYSLAGYEPPAEYRYNAQGQLVQKIQADWDQVTEYAYYETGILKSETVLLGGQVSELREYDSHGSITGISTPSESGSLEYYKQYTNEYDGQGRLICQTWTSTENMGGQTCYSYREDGSYEIDYTDYNFYGEERFLCCHRIGVFTAEGSLVSRKDYTASGAMTEDYGQEAQESAVEPRCDEVYDEANRLIRRTLTYPDMGYGEYVEESIWEYDEAGNLLSFSGWYTMPDLQYFFQGTGEKSWETQEIYQYAPLSQALLQ